MRQTVLLPWYLAICHSFGSTNSITTLPAAQARKDFPEDFAVAGDLPLVSAKWREGDQASLNPWLALFSFTLVVLVVLALCSGPPQSSGRELG